MRKRVEIWCKEVRPVPATRLCCVNGIATEIVHIVWIWCFQVVFGMDTWTVMVHSCDGISIGHLTANRRSKSSLINASWHQNAQQLIVPATGSPFSQEPWTEHNYNGSFLKWWVVMQNRFEIWCKEIWTVPATKYAVWHCHRDRSNRFHMIWEFSGMSWDGHVAVWTSNCDGACLWCHFHWTLDSKS